MKSHYKFVSTKRCPCTTKVSKTIGQVSYPTSRGWCRGWTCVELTKKQTLFEIMKKRDRYFWVPSFCWRKIWCLSGYIHTHAYAHKWERWGTRQRRSEPVKCVENYRDTTIIQKKKKNLHLMSKKLINIVMKLLIWNQSRDVIENWGLGYIRS